MTGGLARRGRDDAMDGLESRRTSNPSRQDADRLRILLIDAHALVLRFMAFAFTTGGCQVQTAGTVEDALRLLAGEPVDLIVADVEMPGLAGPELLQTITQQQPGVPVVLTSTAAAESTAVALRDQVYEHLRQPFSAEDVQQLVERVAEERRRRRTPGPTAAAGPATAVSSVEALYRIGDLACRGSDTAAFVEDALDQALGGLGGDVILALLRDDEGHVTVTQKGDRSVAAELVNVLTPSLESLYASHDGFCLPVSGRDLGGLATPIPAPGKMTGVLCLGRRNAVAGSFDDAQGWLPAYARTIGLSLHKLLLSENLEGNVIDTISSFVVALEAKDVYLKGHSARVSLYAGEIANTMGLAPPQVALARRAGILHDLGKLVIRDSIYRKPGGLTYEGSALMRDHPVNGATILKPLRFLAQEAEAIKRHHERYDGGGYPDGLKRDEIPLTARLIAVADAFDAMTSNRPYRTPIAVDAAVQEVLAHAGTQFDPAVAEAFARIPVARLTEIAGFYDNRPDARASQPANRGLGLAAAARKLSQRKGWSAAHATEDPRRKRAKVIGIAGAAFRRQAREG